MLLTSITVYSLVLDALIIYFWGIVGESDCLNINFLKANWPNDQLVKFFKFPHLPKAYFSETSSPKINSLKARLLKVYQQKEKLVIVQISQICIFCYLLKVYSKVTWEISPVFKALFWSFNLEIFSFYFSAATSPSWWWNWFVSPSNLDVSSVYGSHFKC